MSIWLGFRQYHSLFGLRGVWLAAKSRALERVKCIGVMPPGFSHPLYLRLRSSDVTLFRSILVDLAYEWPIGTTPSVIVDAGANIGFTSVFFARKYPGSKIIAIEPEASNFKILTRNTRPYTNIVPIRAALWRETKPLGVVDPGLGNWAFQTDDNVKVAGRGTVQGVTMKQILDDMALDHVDILKVDIEGAEKEVFENSAEWIDRVDAIVIEIHDDLKNGCRDAVYGAVQDFAIENRQSETTIFLRTSVALPPELEGRALIEIQQRRQLMNASLPFEALETTDC
jgi:FkbM family methyltransferase